MTKFKIKKFFSNLLAVIMMLQTFPSNLVFALDLSDGVKVDASFTSMVEEKGEKITITANPIGKNIVITGIQLPDGTFVEDELAQYTTIENGEYDFKVFYRETIIEEVVPPTEDKVIPLEEDGIVPLEEDEVIPPEEDGVVPPEDDEVIPPAEDGVIPPEEDEVIPPEEDEVIPPEEDEVIPPIEDEVVPPTEIDTLIIPKAHAFIDESAKDTLEKPKKIVVEGFKVFTYKVRKIKKPIHIELIADEDYVAGTGELVDVSFEWDSEGIDGVVDSGNSVGLLNKIQINLKDGVTPETPTTRVWVGLKFILPKTSASGGRWDFVNVSYQWLMKADDTSVVAQPYDDGMGNWILEGVVLVQDNGNPIISGTSSRGITIQNTDGVKGDTMQLSCEGWIIADGDGSVVKGTKDFTVTSSPEFNLFTYLNNDGKAVLSGYFNNITGEFSITKPSDLTGWKYGRVFAHHSWVWKTITGNEKLDPTQPIEWDTSFKVMKTEGSITIEETDPNYQAILLSVRRNGWTNDTSVIDRTKSELATTPMNDISFDGKLATGIYNNTNNYQEFYRGGNYIFASGNGTLNTNVILSPGDKTSGYNAAATVAMYFVPINESDTKDVTRILRVELDNLSLTSFSGQHITTDNDSNVNSWEKRNNISYDVPSQNTGEDVDGAGLFSRTISEGNGIRKAAIGFNKSSIRSTISNTTPSSIIDYNVNAINILVKIEKGIEFRGKVDELWNLSGYDGGERNFLWAVKPDGSDWADEVELNHTQDFQLTYYDSFDEAQRHGSVVGFLLELRGGIWINKFLTFSLPYKISEIKAETGRPYAIVQDVRFWRGGKQLTITDSYKNTNGASVVDKIIVQHADLMVPYDNPKNIADPRVYQKDVWYDGDDSPSVIENNTWGWTIHALGGKVERVRNESLNINGSAKSMLHGAWNEKWHMSTFDIANGERYVDRQYTFEITNMERKPVNLEFIADAKNYMGADKIEQMGMVLLGTDEKPVTYISGSSQGSRGSFSGGIAIDPANFTVPGNGKYSIYWTSFIGDEADLVNDAKVGIYWNESKVRAVGSSIKDLSQDVDIAYATNATKTTITGTNKTAINSAATDEVAYRLSLTATAQDINNVYVFDVLPFNGDGRGTNFSGGYTLKDNKVTVQVSAERGSINSVAKVYYTTDEEIRTMGSGGSYAKSDIFNRQDITTLPDSFIRGGSTFQVATDNGDGTWSLDGTVTAVVLAGNVKRNERIAMTLTLRLDGNKRGDIYANTSSTDSENFGKPMDSNTTKVEVVSREIKGLAWKDQDKDGIYTADNDAVLLGVGVELYRADGSQVLIDANGDAYGDVKTDSSGKYTFEKVPENTNGYYVVFKSSSVVDISDFKATDKYVGGATTPEADDNDSDINITANSEIKLLTDVFKMHSDDQLVAMSVPKETVMGINAGLQSMKQTVTFESNGGVPVPDKQIIAAGKKVAKPVNPTKEGYTFKGWYREDTLTTLWNFDNDVVGVTDMILYAGWELNNYKITAISGINGSIDPLGVTTVNYGGSQNYVVTPDTGYHISELKINGVAVTVSSTYEFRNVNRNQTIEVRFSENSGGGGNTENYYKLTFKTNGGSGIPEQIVEEYSIVKLTQIPIRVGYDFEGWYEDEALTRKIISVYMNKDKIVYAKWTDKTVPPVEIPVPPVEIPVPPVEIPVPPVETPVPPVEIPILPVETPVPPVEIPVPPVETPVLPVEIPVPPVEKPISLVESSVLEIIPNVGITVTPEEGDIRKTEGNQPSVNITDENKVDGDIDKLKFGKDRKHCCALHWILLILTICMSIVTMVKCRKNKKELKGLRNSRREEV